MIENPDGIGAGTMAETWRTFIAIDIPEDVRARIGELMVKLKRTEAGVKWVRPASMHITLRFLGNVQPDRADQVDEAMAEAVAGLPPVEVEIEGSGVFPNERRPRVLWLGLTSGGPELMAVFRRLERALAARGFEPADKDFSPHLTVGRVKDGRGMGRALKVLDSESRRSFGKYSAERLVLFRSELSRDGAKYTELRERRFG